MASAYAEKTRRLWYEGWFYDVDARSAKPIVIPGHREVTQVGPVMCGVATKEQVREMIPAMREYASNQAFWLEWPSHVLPYAESMWWAGERENLSRLLYGLIDRVYASMDRREVQPSKGLGWPGVSCEMWGIEGAKGGEGYGWGATLPAHIIRSIFGFREGNEPDRFWFILSPSIPEALFGTGKSLRLRSLRYRGQIFSLQFRCGEGRKLEVDLIFPTEALHHGLWVRDESGRQVHVVSSDQGWSFEAENYALYHVGYDS